MALPDAKHMQEDLGTNRRMLQRMTEIAHVLIGKGASLSFARMGLGRMINEQLQHG